MSSPSSAGARAELGIVGCGDIFDRYVTGLGRFPGLRIAWCADIDITRAEMAATRCGIPSWGTVDELFSAPDVDVAVILTPPLAHAEVISHALETGKHVYVEKPLAASLGDAHAVVAEARARGLALAAAPDTFLGSACQTARAVLDSGEIGEVIGVSAFVTHHHVETRHPDPTFLFRPGGGPLLDLGPYYMTQLVNCLGPVAEVAGRTRIGHKKRFVTAPNRLIDVIDVQVATHTSAVAEFASGVVATLMMSFDVWERSLPHIEIYGTQGQLQLPDPNTFDGGVTILMHDDEDWRYVPPVTPPLASPRFADQLLRGIGVADLAASLPTKRTPRANGELALHVLEALSAIELSSESHAVVRLETTCERPAPLSADEVDAWVEAASIPAT